MAGNRNNNIRQYRKPLNINLGSIIFSVILIYIIICVFLYFTEKQVVPYEVKEGSLSVGNVYQGIALREETVVMSTESGYINYYAREGEKVGAGKLVCSVDQGGQLKELMESSTREDETLSDSDLGDIRSEITDFINGFDKKQFSSVYDFKYMLEGTALKLSNISLLSDLQTLSQGGSNLISFCNAPISGIVVYSTDGYEGLLPQQITAESFDKEEYVKNQLLNNNLVAGGDAMYKLVTDENWSIVICTSAERAAELEEEEYVQVRFLKNQCVSWARVSVAGTDGENTFVQLALNNSMISFCTERYIDIELITEEEKGLKVPNSAIAEKEFFLIPKDYVTKGNKNEDGVLKEIYSEDGQVSTEFVAVSIYQETDEDYYVDNFLLDVGNNLVKPDSTDRYTISRSATLIGVYNINKGYAEFREIQILYQNDEYSIVKSNTAYGLSAYDRIVLDAETVDVNEFIYE